MNDASIKLEVKNLGKVFSVRESFSRQLEITALVDINLNVREGGVRVACWVPAGAARAPC